RRDDCEFAGLDRRYQDASAGPGAALSVDPGETALELAALFVEHADRKRLAQALLGRDAAAQVERIEARVAAGLAAPDREVAEGRERLLVARRARDERVLALRQPVELDHEGVAQPA